MGGKLVVGKMGREHGGTGMLGQERKGASRKQRRRGEPRRWQPCVRAAKMKALANSGGLERWDCRYEFVDTRKGNTGGQRWWSRESSKAGQGCARMGGRLPAEGRDETVCMNAAGSEIGMAQAVECAREMGRADTATWNHAATCAAWGDRRGALARIGSSVGADGEPFGPMRTHAAIEAAQGWPGSDGDAASA